MPTRQKRIGIKLARLFEYVRVTRSAIDLVHFLDDLRCLGIDLYLHQQRVGTSTPSGRALFQMLGVFAEIERSMISERAKAGLARTSKKSSP
jgi:DNA invertase Pin-like site-specific DNA recombinase